jgi:hypothetical protein
MRWMPVQSSKKLVRTCLPPQPLSDRASTIGLRVRYPRAASPLEEMS